MPAVIVEEVEHFLERFVGDADIRVVVLKVVDIEQAAVEEGYLAQQSNEVGRPLCFGLAKPFVEKIAEERSR